MYGLNLLVFMAGRYFLGLLHRFLGLYGHFVKSQHLLLASSVSNTSSMNRTNHLTQATSRKAKGLATVPALSLKPKCWLVSPYCLAPAAAAATAGVLVACVPTLTLI